MIFVKDNGPASAEAIADLESKLGRLPEDFREFIEAHDGVELSGTATLLGPEKWPIDHIWSLKQIEFEHVDFPQDTIPIADDGTGNTYLMCLAGTSRGCIYFFDHECSDLNEPVEQLQRVARTCAEFLAGIRDFDPEDPESEALFHLCAERRQRIEAERQAILMSKKPWWRFW